MRRFLALTLALSVALTATATTQTAATMQPAAVNAITQTVLFDKGGAGYGCYRIPAIVRTKTGTLLAFAEARRAWCGDSQEIDLVMRRSTDNGRTWSPQKIVLSGTDANPNAVATRGNPTPIADLETGRVVLLSTFDPGTTTDRPRTPYVQVSDDDGVTFKPARSLASEIDDPAWGVQVASAAAPAGSISPGRPFRMYVGQRLDGLHRFDGTLDEVRIYRRALTADELKRIYTSNSTDVPGAVLDLPLG